MNELTKAFAIWVVGISALFFWSLTHLPEQIARSGELNAKHLRLRELQSGLEAEGSEVIQLQAEVNRLSRASEGKLPASLTFNIWAQGQYTAPGIVSLRDTFSNLLPKFFEWIQLLDTESIKSLSWFPSEDGRVVLRFEERRQP